ncbi:MAG: ABC transporter ATP-binding protein [Clostridia bacterium]|jgi:iron(III) transport system ATP-binding protein
MASVQIDAISVDYGKHRVLEKLSLDVRDGESLAVVGPSSCGKTTLMRALCGFIKISEGTIAIDGDVVSNGATRQYIQPEKRNIGVVFQDYAVWPHLTVLENIIYPLKRRRVPKTEALDRARKALAQVKMADFGSRLPAQLSGGQQQRVALARALVSSGSLIVLDEPITNLDAKLREEMAYEIRSLQSSTGVTILYITHDQETAMTIADRMVIMDREGLIHQIGSPEEVWTRPEDKYVFEFLGVSNFVPVRFAKGRLVVRDDSMFQQVDFKPAFKGDGRFDSMDDILLAIRPMDVLMYPKPGPELLTAMVERVTYLGNQFDYIVSLGSMRLRVQQDSYDAFAKGIPLEGSPCGLDLGNSVFYRRSDSKRLELA